jgi:6-pyruvoyl-tetrahydropterin synthase
MTMNLVTLRMNSIEQLTRLLDFSALLSAVDENKTESAIHSTELMTCRWIADNQHSALIKNIDREHGKRLRNQVNCCECPFPDCFLVLVTMFVAQAPHVTCIIERSLQECACGMWQW